MIPLIEENLKYLGANDKLIHYLKSTFYVMDSITIGILDTIADVVCKYYKVPITHLFIDTRERDVVKVRQICHYLAKKYVKTSLRIIGLHLGYRDHATILHSSRAVTNDSLLEPYKSELKEIEQILKKRFLYNVGGKEDK